MRRQIQWLLLSPLLLLAIPCNAQPQCIPLGAYPNPYQISQTKEFIVLKRDSSRIVFPNLTIHPFVLHSTLRLDSGYAFEVLHDLDFRCNPDAAYQKAWIQKLIDFIAMRSIDSEIFWDNDAAQGRINQPKWLMKEFRQKERGNFRYKTITLCDLHMLDTADPTLKCFVFGVVLETPVPQQGNTYFGLLLKIEPSKQELGSPDLSFDPVCLKVLWYEI